MDKFNHSIRYQHDNGAQANVLQAAAAITISLFAPVAENDIPVDHIIDKSRNNPCGYARQKQLRKVQCREDEVKK